MYWQGFVVLKPRARFAVRGVFASLSIFSRWNFFARARPRRLRTAACRPRSESPLGARTVCEKLTVLSLPIFVTVAFPNL
jgi:hypothetical protein